MKIQDIPIEKCTHIMHAFAFINEETLKLTIDDKKRKLLKRLYTFLCGILTNLV